MGMGMEEAVRIGIHTMHFGGHGHGGGSKGLVYSTMYFDGMGMEEAVRIGIHTVYFDGHGHRGDSKDWYTYRVL